MNNALEIYENFETMQRAAIVLYKSGYFKDSTSEAQAIVKVMAGAELGLPPFASMTGIHIISGKPVLGANIIATLVKNDARYDYNIKTCTNESCVIEWFENSKKRGESSFTIAEAKIAGLIEKDNWKKYPSDMLFARAISRGSRRYAPGVFSGSPVYTPDELGVDMDDDGNITVINQTYESTPVPAYAPESDQDEAADAMFLEDEPKPITEPKMSYETASTVTNSKGKLYIDLDSETLANMVIGINKALRDPKKADQREDLQFKKDAIGAILFERYK